MVVGADGMNDPESNIGHPGNRNDFGNSNTVNTISMKAP